MDVEQIELLPCPFCGGKAKLHVRTERQHFSAADAAHSGMGQSAGSIAHTIREIHCECGVTVGGSRVSDLWNSRAAPTPPEGFVLVPVEPTEAMLAAAEEAHMPFGDMGFAISAAIGARPEVKP